MVRVCSLLNQETASTYAVPVCFALFIFITTVVPVPVALQNLVYTLTLITTGVKLSLEQRIRDLKNKTVTAQQISGKEAALSPFYASAGLFLLYVLIKKLSPFILRMMLFCYVALISLSIVSGFLVDVIAYYLPHLHCHDQVFRKKFTNRYLHTIFDEIVINYSPANIAAVILSLSIYLMWCLSKHWLLHNLIAMIATVSSIKSYSVGNFKTVSAMLIGLFVYDIFWVFKTDVMVTVAKNFKAPITLLFYHPKGLSLLGLGDVVIPGFFIALTRRFDYMLMQHNLSKRDNLYYTTSLIAYIVSLACASFAAYYYKHPQPALLYITPSLLISFFITTIISGQFLHVISYNEDAVAPVEHEPSDDQHDIEQEVVTDSSEKPYKRAVDVKQK